MEIFTITNNKGGTSKTTTAQSLAIGLTLNDKKVLLIDSDPQGNLTYVFKLLNAPNNLYRLYIGENNINECRYRVKFDFKDKEYNIDIIPSSHKLTNIDINVSMDMATLKNSIDKVKNDYDYIIIDTPPNLSVLTLNALVSSTSAIIPMNADIFSIQGLYYLKEKIDMIKQKLNPSLYIKGLLLTKYNNRSILNRDLRESIINATKQFDTKLFDTTIRESIILKESQANSSCILLQYPNNNVSIDYMNFVNEIIGNEVI